jgi:hypothetical protein
MGVAREQMSLAPFAKDTASKVPLKEPLLHFIAGESFWSGPGVDPIATALIVEQSVAQQCPQRTNALAQ